MATRATSINWDITIHSSNNGLHLVIPDTMPRWQRHIMVSSTTPLGAATTLGRTSLLGNVLKLFRERGVGDTFLVIQVCPIKDLDTPREKWLPSYLASPRTDSPENENKVIDTAIELVLDQRTNPDPAVSKFAYRVVRALPLEVTVDYKLVKTGAEVA